MRLPLFCLLLGSFSIGTTEFLVAGLLPAIAGDFGVSVADAGLLVTGYALSVVFGGPALMLVAKRYPRKQAIVAIMAIFVLGHVVCALAPSFALLMVGRVIAGAAHGCFFGLAIVLATASVPEDRRGMALAIVVAGINIANIIGVPMGTAVGNGFGWRAAFVMVGVIASWAALMIAGFVANMSGTTMQDRPSAARQMRAILNRKVLTSYVLIVLYMIAFFSLFTFIAPYMHEVAGVGPDDLPILLLIFGLFGTVGIFVGGRLTDLDPVRSLVFSYPVLAVCFAVTWLVTPWSWLMGTSAIAIVWAAGGIAAIATQNRVLAGARRAPELASTLMSSVFNVGIAIGAGLGAWLLARGMPIADMPAIGVVALTVASVLGVVAVVSDG